MLLKSMLVRVKNVLPRLATVITKALAAFSGTGDTTPRKWDKGKKGRMIFAYRDDSGNIVWDELEGGHMDDNIHGGEVQGLLGKFFHLNVAWDAEDLPDPILVHEFMENKSSMDVIKWHNAQYREVFQEIATKYNVWPLPIIRGSAIRYNGKRFRRIICVRKQGSFERSVKKAFEEAFKQPLADEAFLAIGKTLTYFTTSLVKDVEYNAKVLVVDKNDLVDSDVLDGCLYYLPLIGSRSKVEAEFPYHNRECQVYTHKVKLDGRTLHERAISADGKPGKWTRTAATIRQLKDIFSNEDTAKIAVAAAKEGFAIGTKDSLKHAKPGKYDVRVWLHDDSTMHPVLTKGKIMFEQMYRKIAWKNLGGIKDVIERNVFELGVAMRSSKGLTDLLLKYEDAMDPEDLPKKDFVDQFTQVNQGLPKGLNRSFFPSLIQALPKLLKRMSEVHVGTRRYFRRDNSGKVSHMYFDWEKHTGIHARAFIRQDVGLKDYEVSLGREVYDAIALILNKTGTTWNEVTTIVQRPPVLLTSTQKVTVIRRDDNFPGMYLSKHLMKNLGADADGDKGTLNIVKKTMFDFVNITDTRISGVENNKLRQSEKAITNASAERFSPSRESSANPDDTWESKASAMYYELIQADSIGLVDTSILRIMWHYARSWSPNMIRVLIHKLEQGPLQSIIDGKKNFAASVPNLIQMARNMVISDTERVGNMPKGFQMLRGKVDFMKDCYCEEECKGANGTYTRKYYDMQNIPAVIRHNAHIALFGVKPENKDKPKLQWFIDNHTAMMEDLFPVHAFYFRMMLKHFPDKMECTTFDLASFRKKAGFRDNSILVADSICSMFGGVRKPIASGGLGFRLTGRWERDTHDFLDVYWDNVQHIRDTITDRDTQNMLINRLKRPLFDEFVALTTTEKGRAGMELFLLAIACQYSGPDGSSLSFFFNLVDPHTISTFVRLCNGEDPMKYWEEKPEDEDPEGEEEAITEASDFNAGQRKDAIVYGDFGCLPGDIRTSLVGNFNIVEYVEDIPAKPSAGTLIAVNRDYQRDIVKELTDIVSTGHVEVLQCRKSGKWVRREMDIG